MDEFQKSIRENQLKQKLHIYSNIELSSEDVNEDLQKSINEIEKSMNHKYFKREGSPGNYKYYYTEADYKAGKGHGEESKGGKSNNKVNTTKFDKLVKRLEKIEGKGGDYDDDDIGELKESIVYEFYSLAEKVINSMPELSKEQKESAISDVHDAFLDGVEELSEMSFDVNDIKDFALAYTD